MKMNEPLCCPQAVNKPCNLCPSGITAGNDFKPNASDGDETTCKEMIDMLSAYEADSTMFKSKTGPRCALDRHHAD